MAASATLFYNWLEMSEEKGLDLVQLGQSIRALRLGNGWSLAQLAGNSGVSKAYLSDLENGNAGKPNIQYVFSVASALHVTIDDLLGSAKPKVSQREKRSTRDLPPGLQELQGELSLRDEEIQMLAQVNFRGHRPRDKEGWRFLLEALRMVSQRTSSK